ncbi:MAG TPA: LrgB family protein [Negativicutes bacterium]
MLTLFGLLLTIVVYLASKWLYQWSANLLLSPLIVCPLILIAVLTIFHVSYGTYNTGGQLLSSLLQPATVALAVPMHKYRNLLKTHFLEILLSVTSGAIIAIVTSIGAAKILGINPQMIDSLVPRSITTPMAINVSLLLGGDPAITAVFVIITGLTGLLLTSLLLKWIPIKSPITKGMMFGTSAHGTGTARAYDLGSVEGAIASLAMVFMGIITTVIAPELTLFCFHLFSKSL